MLVYVLKRIALALVIIILAVTLLYLMIHAVPGDPATVMLGPRATPELIAQLHERMGLDKPLPVQIVSFFGQVLSGDLGTDVFQEKPVAGIIMSVVPYTLILVGAGIAWSLALGIPLGVFSAVRPDSWIDKLAGISSVAFIAMPAFVVGLYALLLFAVTLGWFPVIGGGEGFFGKLHHLILPAFTVGLGWVGYLARIVRASMLEVLAENHVRHARAHGLSQRVIQYQYVLRIAILPAVTIVGIGIGAMLSGVVFAEIIFARPGLGKLIFVAVQQRNFPLIMGTVLVTTTLFVVATTLSDIVNALLDPRIRERL
ncbi:MAG: peptide ABC transporter permease [Acidiferrobacteraceae bacterium]|jgi:peptide/nickel transport system permease protein|nr:peptide ABC transporter permease [Acidiferrobacteraceae bacterium]|tara:strand:+ start:1065 stop:2003 length:939 start_codon:yes stop_codon:yes gene_type:complete